MSAENKIQTITNKHKLIFIAVMFFSIFGMADSASAETHWVSDTGTATWNNCSGETPLSGTAACSLYTANQNASAGDTVHLRGGDYTVGHRDSTSVPGIKPSNSGSSGNPITYKPYQDEVVNLIGQADIGVLSVGIWINQKSYIKVTGTTLGQLNFSNMVVSILVGPWGGSAPTQRTDNNEISYVYTYGYSGVLGGGAWYQQGNALWCGSYNHIHHNKFAHHGWMEVVNSGNHANLFDLGRETADSDIERTNYNIVENNEFYHGGHATFGWMGEYNIVRNNYFHNEGWYTYSETDLNGWPASDELYAYRNIIGNGRDGYTGHNIFEGNRIGHAAPNYYTGTYFYYGGTALKVCHPYNIIRYNSMFNNSSNAIAFCQYSYIPPAVTSAGDHNYIYNNTFFKNSRYHLLPSSEYEYFPSINLGYIGDGNWLPMYSSVYKNNLFFDNANTEESRTTFEIGNGSSILQAIDPAKGNMTIENNLNGALTWATEDNPLFVDDDLTDPTSWILPNLNLSSDSPAMDGATTYLTQTNGSGTNSTTLIVNEARYFQDAKFGMGSLTWPSSAIVNADWIAIGTVDNVVQISSIDYSTNTITLSSAKSWNDNANIWLFKKSDSQQVLFGSAPDYGAYEYVPPADTTPPSAPQGLAVL